MTLTDAIEWFSSELYLVRKDDTIYLMSSYHLGDESYDYGIYATINANDLASGNFNDDVIPDIFVDEFFRFFQDDLIETYNVKEEDAIKLGDLDYRKWYNKLIDLGYDKEELPGILEDVCMIFNGDRNYEPETITYEGSEEDKSCIEKYIQKLGE